MTREEFIEKMRLVFCQLSGIHPDLFDQLRVISDLDISVGGDIDSELYDILGWDYKRYRHSANDNMYALVLENEDGSIWQVVHSEPKDPRGYDYKAPKGNGNRIYTPPIPTSIREEISDRNGFDVPLNGSFWEWYQSHPEVNLVPTEGAKKALSALSEGFVSLAVYGARCLKSPDLIPYLKDRNVAIALDQDTKKSALHNRRMI
jgi:putative DNA primase/helicase